MCVCVCVCVCVCEHVRARARARIYMCVCDMLFMGMAAGVVYMMHVMIVSVTCMHISCVNLYVHVFMNLMQS